MMHTTSNVPQGRDVLLVHGNSLSSIVWQEQLKAPLSAACHLSTIDLPGHGTSQRFPVSRPYSLHEFAVEVAAHVRTLRDPVLVGHSLGGHICLRVLGLVPGIRGLLMFGTPPLSSAADIARSFLPNPALAKAFQADLTEADATALATALSWEGDPMVPAMARAISATDPRVRADLGAELASGSMADEQAMISASGIPVCVVHGAEDPFLSIPYFEALAAKYFWRGRVHMIAGAGHCPQRQRPEAFNAVLNEFVTAL